MRSSTARWRPARWSAASNARAAQLGIAGHRDRTAGALTTAPDAIGIRPGATFGVAGGCSSSRTGRPAEARIAPMDAPAGTTLGDVTLDELRLAARNHGLPLEALRYAVTPVGLHYLLTHYDIPVVDPDAWRLEIEGLVERPLSMGLDELRTRPVEDLTVTMECAG